MAAPRLLVGLALVLAGGCVQFERGSASDTHDDDEPATGTDGDDDDESPPAVSCDPLVQDCPIGQACALTGGGFACIAVAVHGAPGDVCQAAAECGPGLACVQSAALDDCDGPSCCSSLCEVGDAGACSDPEVCGPIFSGEAVPPTVADYGVCQLPG